MALARSTPSKITKNLYVGSKWHLSPAVLKKFEIKWILNVWRGSSPPSSINPEKFHSHPLSDYGEDALIDEYEDCVEHINKAVQANERILLHCEGGINRSTTIAMIFLMYAEKLSLRDAAIMLKTKREMARPHIGYLRQLPKIEMRIRGISEPTSTEEDLVALFQPVESVSCQPCAGLSKEVWAGLLSDYQDGKLIERVGELSTTERMMILNLACKLQTLITATNS